MQPIKSIVSHPAFLVGLCIKIICLFFFGSEYIHDLFIPFVDYFVTNPSQNPWSVFESHYFPYGPALLAILAAPKFVVSALVGNAALGSTALSMALIKFPLLIFDFGILLALVWFVPKKIKSIIWFYWFNPILFYISYVHGQLDVVSMSFCILSIACLTSRRFMWSACLMAAATLCKFHVVIVIPLMLAFIWDRYFLRDALRRIGAWIGLFGSICLVGSLPVLLADKLNYLTVTSPKAMRVLGFYIQFNEQTLYIGLLAILLTIGRLCLSHHITKEGLIFGCGVIFGVLVAVTEAMPGWYFWVVPFVSLFYAIYGTSFRSLYGLTNLVYLVFFIFLWRNQSNPPVWEGIGFSVLQTSFAAVLIEIWMRVFRFHMKLMGRIRPFAIGIAGDSGSGKDTLTASLQNIFNVKRSVHIEGDNYHLWERGNQNWQTYTHLSPKANDLDTMVNHTVSLLQGQLVYHHHYDHSTGQFTLPREIRSNRFVIVQGLHTLYPKGIRDEYDLKIFLAPHPLVRLKWKLHRDVHQRGHDPEKVLNTLKRRAEDSERYINPQKNVADWIIEVLPKDTITQDDVMAQKDFSVVTRHTFWNDAPISKIAHLLGKTTTCNVSVNPSETHMDRIELTVDGSLTAEKVRELALELFPNLRQITKGRFPPNWKENSQGINQLISIALIQSRYQQ